MMTPWDFESIWGFLDGVFLVLYLMWIAYLILLAVVGVASFVKRRLLPYPEVHVPAGSRRDAA